MCQECTHATVHHGFYCPEGDDENDGVPCPEKMHCPGGNQPPAIIRAGYHVTAGKSEVECVAGTYMPDSSGDNYLPAWRDNKGLYPCRPAAPGWLWWDFANVSRASSSVKASSR